MSPPLEYFSGKLPRKKARSCKDKSSLMAVESESSSSTCEPMVQYAMSTGVNPGVMQVDSAIPPLSKPVLQLVTASQGIAPLGDQNDDSDPSASSSDCDSRGGFSQASFDIDTPIESPRIRCPSTLTLFRTPIHPMALAKPWRFAGETEWEVVER